MANLSEMTVEQLQREIEQRSQQESYTKAAKLQGRMEDETQGRINPQNSRIVSGKYYDGTYWSSVFVTCGNSEIVVGDAEKWEALKSFVQLMTYPSDAEMVAHFESYEAHEDYDFTDCTF